MAENKKSFVAYCDWGETFDALTNEEAGKLAKHLFSYVRDEDPKSDKQTELIFIGIKQALKRDLVKYEQYIDKQSVNGKKGGRPKKTQKTQPFLEKPKKADSVNVSDNVSDNEIIEYIYSLYPSKCPFKNKSLGKCSKDKTKIKSLLKTHTPKEIENKIQFYIKDCNSSNTWYKNFGTLLNNLPEIIEEPIYTKENPKEYVYTPANPVL